VSGLVGVAGAGAISVAVPTAKRRAGAIRRGAATVAVVLALSAVGIAAIVRTSAAPAEPVLGPGPVVVDLGIEHSHFSTSVVRVRPGTTVTFRVANHDPIGHELIVGGPDVHARHESGREAAHPPVAGEVSVPPLATADTTFAFPSDGSVGSTVVFACHLPGHFAYGMHGEVRVVPDEGSER
jgi:uncharacterized cupredoxin-like copper-binding protein